jgi:hypothetical protein
MTKSSISHFLIAAVVALVAAATAQSVSATQNKTKANAASKHLKNSPTKSRPIPKRKVIGKAVAQGRPVNIVGQSSNPGKETVNAPNTAQISQPKMTSPPARDPQLAVQEEFDAAMVASTSPAWDLFIARHPDNPLTARAKLERSKIGPV